MVQNKYPRGSMLNPTFLERRKQNLAQLFIWSIFPGIPLALVAAWITHVVHCIAGADWILLAIGAIVFPVGIIHGIMVWFGFGL